MPIDRDDLEERASRRTNAERVLSTLLAEPDAAFTAEELADRADVDDNSINPVLARLHDRGLVEHSRPYWTIDESVAAAGDDPADVVEGALDPDTWIDAASSLLGLSDGE